METQTFFPPLPLASWQPTRDTLHLYSRLLGKIRGALTPPQKHWWHISLRVGENGLTTPAIPITGQPGATFEIYMDFKAHELVIHTHSGEHWETPMAGHRFHSLYEKVMSSLAKMGIQPEVDTSLFAGQDPLTYDPQAVERYWQALSSIDQTFKLFKAGLPGETSPVQLWPHHFDLALMWLSGNKVPGQDLSNEEYADEQMAFGFSTGDEGIPNPYFYITAYPWPEGLENEPLPGKASWHTSGWKGALLMYGAISRETAGMDELLQFLWAGYRAGSRRMK